MKNEDVSRSLGILSDLTDALQKLSSEYARNAYGGLTTAQGKVLRAVIVSEPHGLMLKELAVALNLTNSTASSLVDSLVRDDLLVREVPPENRRKVCIRLSAKGKEYREANFRFFKKLLEDRLEGIPLEKQEVFFEILRHMGRSVNS